MAMYYAGNEIVEYIESSALKKTKRSVGEVFVLAILAGAFIAFGAVGSFLVAGHLSKVDLGLSKFVSGAVFPVGLMMVILLSLELFTSDCLMLIGVITKKITFKQMLKVLVIVYIGNFVGSIIVGYLSIKTHSMYPEALELLQNTAMHKVHATSLDIFLKAILCNVIVCGGAVAAYSSKDIPGKIFAVWFSIMLFVVLGYDHCIANMLYIPTAIFSGANITIFEFLHNLLFATAGNFIGGALVIGVSIYYANRK